jgi:hypothetical protein
MQPTTGQPAGSRPSPVSDQGLVHNTSPVPDPTIETPPSAAMPASEGGHGTHGGDIHLPPPTIWPFTTAAGVALGGLGLVTTTIVSVLGLIIMVWGLVAWVQELRHERH